MKIKIDGDSLCITFNNFINIQESPAFFVELVPRQKGKFNSLPIKPDRAFYTDGILFLSKGAIFNGIRFKEALFQVYLRKKEAKEWEVFNSCPNWSEETDVKETGPCGDCEYCQEIQERKK